MKFRYFASMLVACVCFSGVMMADAVVGENAPDFHGKTIDGKECSLSQFKGKIVILEWTNPKCPFTRKLYSTDNEEGVGFLSSLQKHYTDPALGVIWILVASADVHSQDYIDAEGWKEQMLKWDAHPTTLIIDDTKEIAKLFGAKCTPEVYIIGKDGIVLYKGAVDSIPGTDPNEVSSPTNIHWLRNGIENALKGRRVIPPETIPYGCPIR